MSPWPPVVVAPGVTIGEIVVGEGLLGGRHDLGLVEDDAGR